jgi:hypothetical protein
MTVVYEIFDHDDFSYDNPVKNPVGFKQKHIYIDDKGGNNTDYYRVLVSEGEVIKPFLQSYEYTVIKKIYTTFNDVIIQMIPSCNFAKRVFKMQYKKQ